MWTYDPNFEKFTLCELIRTKTFDLATRESVSVCHIIYRVDFRFSALLYFSLLPSSLILHDCHSLLLVGTQYILEVTFHIYCMDVNLMGPLNNVSGIDFQCNITLHSCHSPEPQEDKKQPMIILAVSGITPYLLYGALYFPYAVLFEYEMQCYSLWMYRCETVKLLSVCYTGRSE